jgi:hypothetical protein
MCEHSIFQHFEFFENKIFAHDTYKIGYQRKLFYLKNFNLSNFPPSNALGQGQYLTSSELPITQPGVWQ